MPWPHLSGGLVSNHLQDSNPCPATWQGQRAQYQRLCKKQRGPCAHCDCAAAWGTSTVLHRRNACCPLQRLLSPLGAPEMTPCALSAGPGRAACLGICVLHPAAVILARMAMLDAERSRRVRGQLRVTSVQDGQSPRRLANDRPRHRQQSQYRSHLRQYSAVRAQAAILEDSTGDWH